MGTTPAPGVSPDYDHFVTDETGTTPHYEKPAPIEVVSVATVNTDQVPARTLLSDQIAVTDALPVRVAGEHRARRHLVLTAETAAVFLGGPGVTAGTGYKLAAGQTITLPVTGPVYAIAAPAAPATVHVIGLVNEG